MKKSTDSSGECAIDIAPLVSKAMKNDARAAAELWRTLATRIDDCNYGEINEWTKFVADRLVRLVLDSNLNANRVPDGVLIAVGLQGRRKPDALRRFVEQHDDAIVGMEPLDPVPESGPRAKTIALARYVIAIGLVPPESRVDAIVKRIEYFREGKE